MEALTATSAAPAALPVPAQRAESAPAPAAAPTAASMPAAALPPLPAAVQRQQIQVPEPKLMTREQMAALLELAAG